MSEYDFGLTVWKGLKALLLFGIPAGLAVLAQWDPVIPSLTIGTIAIMVVNYLKNKG